MTQQSLKIVRPDETPIKQPATSQEARRARYIETAMDNLGSEKTGQAVVNSEPHSFSVRELSSGNIMIVIGPSALKVLSTIRVETEPGILSFAKAFEAQSKNSITVTALGRVISPVDVDNSTVVNRIDKILERYHDDYITSLIG